MSDERILVVDDEPHIRQMLRIGFALERYDVRTAGGGTEAVQIFRAWRPALVITDLRMPDLDGHELCRRIRDTSSVPIIVLSVRGDESVKVEALNLGADDYVTKPFSFTELLARARAVLRRAEAAPNLEGAIEVGDFSIDSAQRAASVSDRPLQLTPKEFQLLAFLARNSSRVLPHRTILSAVWGRGAGNRVEYLRVFMNRLRAKIETNPTVPRYLLTEPSVGYRFDPGQDIRELGIRERSSGLAPGSGPRKGP